MKCAHHQSGQRGFTLVELMIAIVISLILLAGVLNIMLSNQSSLRTQNALAGLQARARLLNLVLDNAFAQAGYKVDPTANSNTFPSQSKQPTIRKGAFIAARSTADKVFLRVRFHAAGGLSNCFGDQVGEAPDGKNSIDIDDLTIRTADFALLYRKGKNRLYCKRYNADDVDVSGSESDPMPDPDPLINNIREFRTRFALDTDGDGSVDQYVGTLSQSQQIEVLAVRIQALLQTEPRRLSTSVTQTFTFMDGSSVTVNDSQPENDVGRGFFLFDRTVALKNAIP